MPVMTPAVLRGATDSGATDVRPWPRVFPHWQRPAPDATWDALLVFVALFVATAVGRVHQLFPVLAAARLTLVSAVLALGLYVVVQEGPRRIGLIASPTTTALLAFLCWAAASVPGALNQGQAFHLVAGDLAKSVLLYAVMVGCVRGTRDVQRLCLVYFAAAVTYAAVVLTRFSVGGAHWRLGDLYYYDSTRVNLGLFQHDVNVVWDLAPHDLSIMDFLIREKPEAVLATGERHLNGLVDVAFITVYFPGNTIAHINVNWLSPVKVRTTLIGGEKKMLVWNDLEADEKVKVYDKGVQMNNGHGVYELLVSYRSGDMWAPRVDQVEALKV